MKKIYVSIHFGSFISVLCFLIYYIDQNNSLDMDKTIVEQEYLNMNNIIFIETNENKITLSSKVLCALESAALNNPNSLILLFASNVSILDSKIFQKYTNIQVKKLLIEDVFNGTALMEWWRKFKHQINEGLFKLAHISDALRLALLLKYGGMYMDSDTITIKNLDSLLEFPGLGAQTDKELANGFLNFPKNHKFIRQVIDEFSKSYTAGCWSCGGPVLISKVFRDYCKSKNFIQTHQLTKDKIFNYTKNPENKPKCEIFVYPIGYFYHLPYFQSHIIFEKNSSYNKQLFKDSYGIHIWNHLSSNFHARSGDGSIYEYYSKINCPYLYNLNPSVVF